ncbi:THUMP domain-containing protein, partial [Azotobacter chroococcum]|nr:THUMP domain-containing protein [Azotobacter chroococcum]
MKLIVKPFAEITIKSRPVRKQFIRQLGKNIRTVLRDLDPALQTEGEWDNVEVQTQVSDPQVHREMFDRLRCTPGIAHFLEVHEYPLGDFDDVTEKCKRHFGEQLPGKVFAVRCKRSGNTHDFTSMDVATHVGSRLRREC